MKREDFTNCSVGHVREICQSLRRTFKTIDSFAKMNKRPAKSVEGAKQAVTDAARDVAKEAGEGKITKHQVRDKIAERAPQKAKKAEDEAET